MTTSRLQLALNVSNIEQGDAASTSDLFGVQAAKQRPGYANFEVPDPPLKLVLFENPGATPPQPPGCRAGDRAKTSWLPAPGSTASASPTAQHQPTVAATPSRTRSGSTPPTSRSAAGSSTRCSPTTRATPTSPASTCCGADETADTVQAPAAPPAGDEELRPTHDRALTIDDVTVDLRRPPSLSTVSDSTVEPGAIVGVLGHNGAGKTTLVRVRGNAATATHVAGSSSPAWTPPWTRSPFGAASGSPGSTPGWTTTSTREENLEMVGRILGLGRAARGNEPVDLLGRFELGAVADRRIGTLSGGIRRRVDLAASLVGSPMVLFLDEPTTGLDPAARIGFWDVVRELAADGHRGCAHHPVPRGSRPAR